MFQDEEWKQIKDFPNYYVSSYGRVKHKDRINARKITINKKGFPVILLSDSDSPTRYLRQVNKLVAQAFLPKPLYDDATAIWHKDGDLTNCHYKNLMWDRRDRVLEWNEMHRTGRPKYKTPPVKNNRTGEIYKDAYDCAINEGELESVILFKIERQASSMYNESERYRYVPDAEIERSLQ